MDIFGFEVFPSNGFNQLCINYCNERLQQGFNAYVFEKEQEEYRREGILWDQIEWRSNSGSISAVDGLMDVLDESCLLPTVDDGKFYLSAMKRLAGSPEVSTTRRGQAACMFSVSHYAGDVEYGAEEFVELNKDEVPQSVPELLETSGKEGVRRLAKRARSYFQEKRGRRGSIVNR